MRKSNEHIFQKKKTAFCLTAIWLAVIFLPAFLVMAQVQVPPPPPPPPPLPKNWKPAQEKIKTGMELVDGLQEFLERLPRMKHDGIVACLEGLRSDARESLGMARISQAFFDRFQRLIRVERLALTDDPDRILKPCIDRELSAFIHSALGRNNPKYKVEITIQLFSEAVAAEMTGLRADSGITSGR